MKKVFLVCVLALSTHFILAQRIDPWLDLLHKSKFDPENDVNLKRNTVAFSNARKVFDNRENLMQFFKQTGIKSNEVDPVVNVLMEYNGSLSELKLPNVEVNSQIGSFITARFPISKLEEIKKIKGVVEIELSKPVKPELEISRDMVNANLAHNSFPYRGDGVVVGIIDTGIDYDLDGFKTSDLSTSRIQYIWDQTRVGNPPALFNYGVEWNNAEINAGGIPHRDFSGHGTHVAGIIAGNGWSSGFDQTDFIGIAPEADIIMVKYLDDRDPAHFPTNSPLSGDVIDGILYIRHKAQELNKPWVVNLSIGMEYGPRDGTSLFERTIAEIINDHRYPNDGRVIVKSVGNHGYDPTHPRANDQSVLENKIHAGGNGPDQREFIIDDIQQYSHNQVGLEIYYPRGDNDYAIQITSPNNHVVYLAPDLAWEGGPTPDGFIFIGKGYDSFNDGERDEVAFINLGDDDVHGNKLASGTWKFTLIGSTGEWDAYVHDVNTDNTTYFTNTSYTNDNLISEPGNVPSVITVGSFNSKDNWISINGPYSEQGFPYRQVSYFSSPGPTRLGIQKPEIYAPGAWIASLASADQHVFNTNYSAWDPEYYHRAGTSLAAAHVTGAVALLLEKWNVEKEKNYSSGHIRQILDDTKWYDGLLDIHNALTYDDVIVGLEDHIQMDNYYCSGGNPTIIEPGVNNHYCARFIDDEPYGDYAVSYSWRITATNSLEGEVVLASHSTGQSDNSHWYLNLSSSLLEDKNWIRDENGNIQATVSVRCYDDDGNAHSDDLNIGIKFKPNTPIISNYSISGSSITFSYLAAGATNFKIHYDVSSGAPYNGTGANEGSSPITVGSANSYTLTGLDFDNNIYYFAITATNGEGESPYSDEIRVGDVYELVWMDLDGVKANGNSLTKSRIRNNWYEGAASFNELPPNTDGWIEMTAVENNTYRMFGLSNFNEDASWNTIDYNFYVRANGTIQIYESGSLKCNCGNYSAGDKIMVERQGSQILYKLNGNTIYTSSCDPSESLIADVSLYSISATISNAVASFPASNTDPYEVEWTDLVKVYVDNNSLTRDDSYRGWNAGAATINRLPTWTDGWVGTTVQETNSYRMFGLSSDNSDPNWNTIDYNMYLRQDGKLYIYESGSYIGNFGNYNSGDLIKIERVNDNILYKKNGQILHTSSCDPSTPLIGDVSMYSPSSTLYDVVSSFRRYDQYITQLQSVTALQPEDDFFVDPTIVSTDSVINESKSVVNSKSTISNTIANEAILSDSTNYNPLSEIKINPNPTTGRINLSYSSESSNKIQIEVIDNLNLLLIEKTWKIKEGKNNMSLDLSSYPGKIFIVKSTDKDYSYTFKVLKE